MDTRRDSQQKPEAKPAYKLCPVGFVVHPGGHVDATKGCGHRRCYPSSCEILKRLDPK